jgi:hypothetical protein
MTTRELERAGHLAKVTAMPSGEAEHEPGEVGSSAYGPVEIVWYPDRLRITALGAGQNSMTETYLGEHGDDLVVEIRLPTLEELVDLVPGAD